MFEKVPKTFLSGKMDGLMKTNSVLLNVNESIHHRNSQAFLVLIFLLLNIQ